MGEIRRMILEKETIHTMVYKLLLAAAAVYWCVFLRRSDARIEPYLLIAILALAGSVCVPTKKTVRESKESCIAAVFGSALLSFVVVLANYSLFPLDYNGLLGSFCRVMNLCIMLASGYLLFRQIFRVIYWRVSSTAGKQRLADPIVSKRLLVFSWLVLAVLYLAALFLVFFPGLYSVDSVDQIEQILSGTYTNHHPFYHTQLIRLCLMMGTSLFGSINAGVAVYSVFSVLLLSGCFAYVIYSVYDITGNRKLAVVFLAWYLLMPYHITYSVTMWKDVPFAAASTFFITSSYRILKGKEKRNQLDKFIWILSGVGVCLLRSNGFLAFAASAVVFAMLFWKDHKRMLLVLVAILCGCFVLKHPVLKALDVAQPDTIESLSVPLQQISRTVLEGRPLTPEQRELLNQVVDVDRIQETYIGRISDPMKALVRERNNQQYLTEHRLEFLKLYVSLGIRNPDVYLHAWVEQTKGYWNGGYNYWRWCDVETAPYFWQENSFGLEHSIASQSLFQLYLSYAALFKTPLLQCLSCIGLYSWTLIFAVYATWLKRDKEAFFTSVMPIMIIGTLLVATPVHAEFRYAYSVVCVMPLILTASFQKKASKGSMQSL